MIVKDTIRTLILKINKLHDLKANIFIETLIEIIFVILSSFWIILAVFAQLLNLDINLEVFLLGLISIGIIVEFFKKYYEYKKFFKKFGK